ncbi:MAG: 30S ribosomal protein S6e [Candidatus Aenigmarchaeota archaeon]|nr:30S ribosomal protein S6e [Candidatus Aenigmarchaeota archaeon]
MVFKIVISEPKSRKAWQIEKDAPSLMGKKIGEQFDGSLIGLSGFTLQITGGSDKDGFPMRPDLEGSVRKKALLSKGIGFRGFKKIKKKKYKRKGMRKRKYIRGNTISENIIQVNCKILEGEGNIPMILGIKPKEEEKKEEAPKTEAPEPEVEQPKAEIKPEKPAVEKEEKKEVKEEPKKEDVKEG